MKSGYVICFLSLLIIAMCAYIGFNTKMEQKPATTNRNMLCQELLMDNRYINPIEIPNHSIVDVLTVVGQSTATKFGRDSKGQQYVTDVINTITCVRNRDTSVKMDLVIPMIMSIEVKCGDQIVMYHDEIVSARHVK